MKIIKGSTFKTLTPKRFLKYQLGIIESGGRICYQSEKGKITLESTTSFINKLLNNEHLSVIEHSIITVKFMGFSIAGGRELLRHRIASPSVESTRYVKVGDFNFCFPPHRNEHLHIEGKYLDDGGKVRAFNISITEFLRFAEAFHYGLQAQLGWVNEDSRQFIFLGECSDIIFSANIREWRHIFELRLAKEAHWEIRALMVKLVEEFKTLMPTVFDDFVKAGIDKNGVPYYVKKITLQKMLKAIKNFFKIATKEEAEKLIEGFKKERESLEQYKGIVV